MEQLEVLRKHTVMFMNGFELSTWRHNKKTYKWQNGDIYKMVAYS